MITIPLNEFILFIIFIFLKIIEKHLNIVKIVQIT